VAGASAADIAQSAAAQVRAYLDAGFAPLAAEGAKVALIGVVVRRAKFDNVQTPIIDMYRVDETGNKRFIRVYLNTPDDVKAFERAVGRALSSIPLYEGTAPLQLDEEAQKHLVQKYAIRVRPFQIEWRANPKYAGRDDKKNPARLFVRYADTDTSDALDDASERGYEAVQMTTEVRTVKGDGKKWFVKVTTRDGTITLPAEVIKTWSMHEAAKDELRQQRVISEPLEAVFRRGELVDVREPEIEI
jgi:hypothetical protein